ncbi:uncharacterized protein G2W53_021837 [Senna tora]|uniref:Secreted protein n=1 Tax=Senna tora TaxID=362788 RepID=A0A834TK69_9FABA|nr:uncharacterized protein G2W53_021837 [Senna tora]
MVLQTPSHLFLFLLLGRNMFTYINAKQVWSTGSHNTTEAQTSKVAWPWGIWTQIQKKQTPNLNKPTIGIRATKIPTREEIPKPKIKS